MKYLSCLLLTACAAGWQPAHAQAGGQPGYVVLPAGDTLRGQLDQQTVVRNGLSCRFQPTGAAGATTYGPTELRGYGLPGATYRALALPTPAGPGPVRFAEVLRDGPAQLYFFRDGGGDHYYLRTPHLPLTELRHEYREVASGDHTFQEEQNGFRVLLAQGLAGCPAAQTMLPRLAFGVRSFERAIDLFNQCVAPAAGRPTQPAPLRPRVGVALVGGVQQGQLTYYNDPFDSDVRHSASVTGAVYGAALWLQPARLRNRLQVRLQVLYQPQQFTFAYTPPYHGGLSGQPVSASGQLHYLRLPLAVRYRRQLGPLFALLEGGTSVGLPVQTSGTYAYTDALGASQHIALDRNKPLAGTDYTLLAGLGLGAAVVGGRELTALVRLEGANFNRSDVAVMATGLRLYGLLSLDLTR